MARHFAVELRSTVRVTIAWSARMVHRHGIGHSLLFLLFTLYSSPITLHRT